MPLSESYPNIVYHLKMIGDLSSYNISIANQYSKDVYLDMGNEKPIGRVITFGNSIHTFKIDLTNKEAQVKHLMDGLITYKMSDQDVEDVKLMIADSLFLTYSQAGKCKCDCHKPNMQIMHAFPCCQ